MRQRTAVEMIQGLMVMVEMDAGTYMQQSMNMPPFSLAYRTKKPVWSSRSQVCERTRKGVPMVLAATLALASRYEASKRREKPAMTLSSGWAFATATTCAAWYVLLRSVWIFYSIPRRLLGDGRMEGCSTRV